MTAVRDEQVKTRRGITAPSWLSVSVIREYGVVLAFIALGIFRRLRHRHLDCRYEKRNQENRETAGKRDDVHRQIFENQPDAGEQRHHLDQHDREQQALRFRDHQLLDQAPQDREVDRRDGRAGGHAEHDAQLREDDRGRERQRGPQNQVPALDGAQELSFHGHPRRDSPVCTGARCEPSL